ncbi:MAG TPA: hypothetical protein VIH67_12085 [Candidatus Acidoferrum sp.]
MPVQMMISFLASLVLTLSSTGQIKQPNPQRPLRITGTYSNMYYNSEGGDVIGDEVRIVNTRRGYQGVLQISEGAPEQLVIVDVKVAGTNVSFSIPDSSPYAGTFDGKVENGILTGEFHFKTGGADKVELKRGKSYWD